MIVNLISLLFFAFNRSIFDTIWHCWTYPTEYSSLHQRRVLTRWELWVNIVAFELYYYFGCIDTDNNTKTPTTMESLRAHYQSIIYTNRLSLLSLQMSRVQSTENSTFNNTTLWVLSNREFLIIQTSYDLVCVGSSFQIWWLSSPNCKHTLQVHHHSQNSNTLQALAILSLNCCSIGSPSTTHTCVNLILLYLLTLNMTTTNSLDVLVDTRRKCFYFYFYYYFYFHHHKTK